jgi:hypothetical protein
MPNMSRIQIIASKEHSPCQTIDEIHNDNQSNLYLATKPNKVALVLSYDHSSCLYRWVCIEGYQITINCGMDFANIKDALRFIIASSEYKVYRFSTSKEMFHYIYNDMSVGIYNT